MDTKNAKPVADNNCNQPETAEERKTMELIAAVQGLPEHTKQVLYDAFHPAIKTT